MAQTLSLARSLNQGDQVHHHADASGIDLTVDPVKIKPSNNIKKRRQGHHDMPETEPFITNGLSDKDDVKHLDQSDADSPDLDVQGRCCDSSNKPNNIPWLTVFKVFMMQFLLGINYYSFGILYFEFTSYFRVPQATGGWIGSIQLASSMLLAVFFSGPVNVYGCRRMGVVGTVLVFVGLVSSALAPNVIVLYFTFGLITGVGSGILYLIGVVISQREFHVHRTLLTMIVMVGYSAGYTVSPSLIVFLVDFYGWRGTLLIESSIIAHILAIVATFPAEKQATGHNRWKSIFSKQLKEAVEFTLLKRVPFLLFNIATILHRFMNISYIQHLGSRIVHVGMSKAEAAVLLSIVTFVGVPSRLLVGFVGDLAFVNRTVVYGIGVLIGSISSLIVPVGSTLAEMSVSPALHGLHMAMSTPLTSVLLVDLMGVQHISRAMAINNAFFGLATLVCVPFSGWLFDVTQNYDIPFYVNGGLGIGACCLIAVIYFRERTMNNKSSKDLDVVAAEEKVPSC